MPYFFNVLYVFDVSVILLMSVNAYTSSRCIQSVHDGVEMFPRFTLQVAVL